MSTTIGKLTALLTANSGGFTAKMNEAAASTDNLGSHATKLGGIIAGLGAGFALFKAFEGFQEAEQASAKLDAVLKSTGNAAGLTGDEIRNLAGELQQVTTFEDDATVAAAAVLATFTSIKGDQFKQAIVAAQDLSAVLGQDLKSSVTQLGKALNDPVQGVTALRKVGVSFTAAQQQQIKTLQESGNLIGAQTIVLRELKTEFGGAAEAVGNTFSGKVQQAKNAIGDLGETVIGTVAPGIAYLANTVKSAAEWAQRHADAIRLVVKAFLVGVGAVAAYRTVLYTVVAAQKAVAAAEAVALALSGPAGWAKLAVGAAAAAGAVYLVNKSFDGIATAAPQATGAVAQLNAELDKTNESSEANKLTDDIEKFIAKLREQIDTFGMSARQAELYKLQMAGATGQQLHYAEALTRGLDQMEAFRKSQEDMAEAAKRLWDETRTPMEKHEERLRQINELAEQGAIDEETRQRAVDQATEDFLKSERRKEQAKPKHRTDDTKVAALERRFTAGFTDPNDKVVKTAQQQLAEQKTTNKHLSRIRDLTPAVTDLALVTF